MSEANASLSLEDLVPHELTAALGDPLPDEEAKLWFALSPDQRNLALKRLYAISRWHGERAGWTADDAARAAKLSRSRFYRIAMQWEDVEQRSLRLLGVKASAPRKRRSRYRGELLEAASAEAARLVAEDRGAPRATSELVRQLAVWLRHRFTDVPGDASLRTIVIEARRQAEMSQEVGADIAFDVCACSISAGVGRPYKLFTCLDRGTGLILGFELSDTAPSLMGHRNAARDALFRLGSDTEPVPWADCLARVEFVIGADLAEFRDWEANLRSRLLGINVQGSNNPRRFGRYLKEHVGTAIGRVRLLPSLTLGGTASVTSLTREIYSLTEALARVELEVLDHNRDVGKRLSKRPSEPPAQTIRALRIIAGLP